MSHGKIREDKTCLNCGHTVQERFCPNCGQENTETKQPFHYLFTHFIEDFTHYDGQFWKTGKYLLFNPGKLTKEYLAGKRQTCVAPVKLYIFVSFITFFLPSLFSRSEESGEKQSSTGTVSQEIVKDKQEEKAAKFKDGSSQHLKSDKNILKTEEPDSNKTNNLTDTGNRKITVQGASNMKQFDSLYAKDNSNRLAFILMRPVASKVFHLQDQGLEEKEIYTRFAKTFVHTIPKALFAYLPLFAFFLWIFHNKKKWWYFDHGIFTLHYFSFLLSGILILIFFKRILGIIPDNNFVSIIEILAYIAGITYMFIYFFIAHHRVYESSKRISLIKGFLLLTVNLIGILFMLCLLIYVSFILIH